MIYIGCHLSVTDGYEAMGKTMSRFEPVWRKYIRLVYAESAL